MLSSPGAALLEILKGIRLTKPLDIEAIPFSLSWFDEKTKVFLSESNQLYLEITLTCSIKYHAYSIYNSFRKEEANWCHLTEFHHIEYESKIPQEENENTAIGLIKHIIKSVIDQSENEVLYFVERLYRGLTIHGKTP